MNFENIIGNSSNKSKTRKAWCAKTAAVSFSLILGACATTGEKAEPAGEVDSSPVKQSTQAQAQDKVQEPSAAQLMKTLKAPLVEPPEAKVVKEKTVPVVVEVNKKTVAEAIQKQEGDKVILPLKKDVNLNVAEQPVVEQESVAKESKEMPQAVAESISAKAFNVSASKLPFTYDIWTIRQGNTPLTKGLVIATPTWEMGKEGYTSQIWLTMMEDSIHVNSSSDIETASKGLGIRIDDGDLIPFSSIADNNIGVIKGQWLNKLAAANKVDVYLGFFPGKKPTSETFTSDLSLKNLARMVATYRMLNN